MLTTALLFAAVPGALGLNIPSNVQSFYNNLKTKGACDKPLASGFYNSKFEGGDMSYCGDHLEDYGIIYLQGPGKFSNMDIDCDGDQGAQKGQGGCKGGEETTQESTSVGSLIKGYGKQIEDLNPHTHSFVVFGNYGERTDFSMFDPREYQVEKASVMAVVCGDQLFYGIWGDSHGNNGDRPSVGEASLSLAQACFGEGMKAGDGDSTSHDTPDVLYIAFTGSDAVPGADGADWDADSFDTFHNSLLDIGSRLIGRISDQGAGGNSTSGSSDGSTTYQPDGSHTPSDETLTKKPDYSDLPKYGNGDDAQTNQPSSPGSGKDTVCIWIGHCEGDDCSKDQDCDGTMTCSKDKRCAPKQ